MRVWDLWNRQPLAMKTLAVSYIVKIVSERCICKTRGSFQLLIANGPRGLNGENVTKLVDQGSGTGTEEK